MEFDAEAQRIRKEIQRFSTGSFIKHLIDYLKLPAPDAGEVAKMPWIALLAFDWCLELAQSSGTRTASRSEIRQILNKLWRTQHLPADFENDIPFQLPLRALLIPQLRLQLPESLYMRLLVRTFHIIDKYDSGGVLAARFKSTHHVSLKTFVSISWFLCVVFSNSKTNYLTYSSIVASLSPNYKENDITNTLAVIGCSLQRLIKIAGHDDSRLIKEAEYFKDSESPLVH